MLHRLAQAYETFHKLAASEVSHRTLKRKISAAPETQQEQDAPEPGAPGLSAGAPSSAVRVTKFITIPLNQGRKGQPFPAVTKTSDEDSDTEAAGGNSSDLSAEVLTKRNTIAMRKSGMKVLVSHAKPKPGNGLFAAKPLSAGVELPVKGPWFDTVQAAEEWLGTLHPVTAASTARKVVQVTFRKGEGEVENRYKAVTCRRVVRV
ncbi:MAG: hypothetical protein GY772_16950 [bacterium]|nr:hypothetical protein [bacterium]